MLNNIWKTQTVRKVAIGREMPTKRYTLRLYRDNPSDHEVIAKMEELFSGKRFRNRNELFRRGIELAYAEYRGGEYQEQPPAQTGSAIWMP